MPREPEVAQLVRAVQAMLEGYKFSDPKKMHGDEHHRELLRLSILSPPDEVWAPNDGRPPLFGANHAYDDEKGAHLIAQAISGDVNAGVVLSAIAAHYVRNECVLPPKLRDYITRKLESPMSEGKPWPEPRTRGRKRNGNARRDFIIAFTVSALIKDGFPIESGRAQHSASSIVADALTNLGITLDDRSVVRIWKSQTRAFLADRDANRT